MVNRSQCFDSFNLRSDMQYTYRFAVQVLFAIVWASFFGPIDMMPCHPFMMTG